MRKPGIRWGSRPVAWCRTPSTPFRPTASYTTSRDLTPLGAWLHHAWSNGQLTGSQVAAIAPGGNMVTAWQLCSDLSRQAAAEATMNATPSGPVVVTRVLAEQTRSRFACVADRASEAMSERVGSGAVSSSVRGW